MRARADGAAFHVDARADRHQPARRAVHLDVCAALEMEARQPTHLDVENARPLRRVHDPQLVDVLDVTPPDLTRDRGAVPHDVHLEWDAQVEPENGCNDYRPDDRRVSENARPQCARDHLRAGQLALHRVLGRIPDEPARVAHLVHHLVAAVDAGCAPYALVLKPVPDVDAGGTDLHADVAVHAVAQPERLRVGAPRAWAPRLAPFLVVGDGQRVLVEHRALETRVRT